MPITCTMLIQTLSSALSGAPNIWAGVKWVGHQIDYVRHYKSNIENLPGRVEELTGPCKSRLQHSVDDAKRNVEEIEEDVLEWFERVNKITEDADGLVNQLQQQRQNCLFGFCPNVKSRYQMSKKAKKEIEPAAVQEVERASKFTSVGYRTQVKSRFKPVEGFEGLESRKETFDQVMKALSDPGINKIGVYGLGGVGKSTLLKHVTARAEEGKLFDHVVLVNVSDPPDVKEIQKTIADKLGLTFKEESLGGRADRLSERLKSKTENKILVILDNVLRKISFEDIGIPPEDAHKGCKILMSSRYLEVLSSQMGTRKNNIHVGFMPEEEARSLFLKMAGDVVLRDERLRDIATQLAQRCGGMPLSIVTVARTLKTKSLEDWKDALKQLPVIGDEEILEDKEAEMNDLVARLPHLGPQVSQMDLRVHLTLELCLKRLTNEAKSLFLLCAITHVLISDLVKYSIGLGLFKRVKTVEEARDRLHKLVGDLQGCCLLLEGGQDGVLQMHDTVRSFGVLFASKSDNVLSVHVHDEFEGWPSTDFLQRCTAITLEHDKIHEVIPEGLECPLLNFIHLRSDLEVSREDHSLKISNNTFEGTKNLKVLDLTGIHLLSLPPSFHSLENLQTLCVDQCDLGGIDGIGELKTLKVLSLLKAMIAQLPEEISQLTNLQLLDLTGCYKLRVIPANVLSRLAKLEALYMRDSFVAWDKAMLVELKGLLHLTTLEIHIPDANVLPRDFFSKNLERYKILIGDVWDWSENYQTSRMLKLKLNTSIDSFELHGIRALLKKTEDLHVDGLKGVGSVLYDLDREGFPQLKHLHVQQSPDLLFIVDSSKEKVPRTTTVFPILESLSLYELINLEKLIHGQLAAESLVKLKTIEVQSCDSLRNMFSFYVAKQLSGQLEELKVTNCKLMEEIVVGEDEASNSHADHIDRIEYTQLRSLTLERLPLLSSFYSSIKTPPSVTQRRQTDLTSSMEISSKDELTTPSTLFSEKVSFPNLEYLTLCGPINIERIWNNDQCGTMSCLTRLEVTRCGRLKSLFSYSTVQSLVQLKTLCIRRCESLEEVIVTEDARPVKKFLFPKLDRLELEDLPKLARFCSCPENSVEFPSLRILRILECHDLKTFVTESMFADMTSNKEPDGTHAHTIALFGEKVGLPSLEDLRIKGMNNLEKIWNNNLLVEDSFCRLKELDVSSCEMLLNIFPSNYMLFRRIERLEELRVSRCGSLQEVFEHQKMGYASSSSNHYATELMICHLKWLTLRHLPNLKHVWKNHEDNVYRSTLSFPSLREVEVYGCDNVETLFASGNLDFQNYNENRENHQIPTAQPLFLVDEVTFPKLEELTLRGNKKMKEIWRGPCSGEYFCNLKVLHLKNFLEESVIFPSSFLQTLHNLEKLVVRNASFEEIFPDKGLGGAERRQGLVTMLRELELSRLPNLMHLWKDDFQAGPIFQNLATLEVFGCRLLECLVPSSISFHSLTTLEVSRCHGLKHLITPRTAKSLVQLARLRIIECDMMSEVITNEGGDTKDEICFSHLKDLHLQCLSSITTYCSGNYTFEFPNLEDVLVSQCPKMRTFSGGVMNTPKLEKIRVEEYTNENGGCWEGNLNATVQRLFTEQDESRSLTL